LARAPYRFENKPFARGGYASLYIGWDRETGDPVAIKRPKGDPESIARFRREVSVQGDLDHPNVMPVLGASTGRDAWLAMPLGARTLTKAIETDGNVSLFQLIDILKQIARGLDHAHSLGHSHRDVNPNNVIELREHGPRRWVVSDWGLVRPPRGRPSSPRLTSRAVGTEGFMSPEAYLDPASADAIDDVYSLGRIAHFGATGMWPNAAVPMPAPGERLEAFVERCTAPRGERVVSMMVAIRMLNRADADVQRMHLLAETVMCPRCELPISGARCEQCGTVWD
jgi:serine/threonine protein kinase